MRVHRLLHVLEAVELVHDHARGVKRTHKIAGLREEVAPRDHVLVAERPDHHRRVVLVAHHHAAVAVKRSRAEARIDHGVARSACNAGEMVLPLRVVDPAVVAASVRLEVRLVHEVEAVLVRKVIPARIVRVVAQAHAVYVVALHELDVLDHPLVRNCVAMVRVHLVAVHALEQDRLSV